LVLHVRRNNARAIACYEKCGFTTVMSGRKLRTDGTAIEFYRMERPMDP
jgi:ribosomal protein S18 acetylase RimI-like enzyme